MSLPDRKINPAKRGDLFVFPVYHSVAYLHDRTEEIAGYELAVVTSISREGLIKGYQVVGSSSAASKGTPLGARLIPASRIDVDRASTAYVDRHDWDREFKTLNQATEFLRHFLKLAE